MKPEDYLDLAIRMIVAFFIPLGWAAILYPLIRKFKKSWPVLVIAATLLSFGLLIFKEITEEGFYISNKIIAYLLGIFFGGAVLSLLFIFKNRWLQTPPEIEYPVSTPEGGKFGGPSKETSRDTPPLHRYKDLHMRYVFYAAILMEEQGKYFYDMLAKKVADLNTKDLCLRLARDEVNHKVFVEKNLYQWLPLPPEKKTLALLDQEIKRWNIYLDLPDINSTEEYMARYAVEQEIKMADFYLSFKSYFSDAWKKMNIETLVLAERSHADKLIEVYPQFKEMVNF